MEILGRRHYKLSWEQFDDEWLGGVTITCLCETEFYVESMDIYRKHPCPNCGLNWKMMTTAYVYPVVIVPSKQSKLSPRCDMFDTDLCKHYQTKNMCHYKETHNVRCVINKFTGTALAEEEDAVQ